MDSDPQPPAEGKEVMEPLPASPSGRRTRNGLPIVGPAEELRLFRRFWLGGASNEKELRYDEVDEKQLKRGVEVEMEHTPDRLVAMKVALDHLAENDRYYDYLDKMERSWKRGS